MKNDIYFLKQSINQEIRKIPKKNKHKFLSDYMYLIYLAQGDDYDSFEIKR